MKFLGGGAQGNLRGKKGICSLCDESALDPHLLRSAVAAPSGAAARALKMNLISGCTFWLRGGSSLLFHHHSCNSYKLTGSLLYGGMAGSSASLSTYPGAFVRAAMDRNSTATPQWMKWKDLSCPDSHYLITVLSAFSFSLKMFGSVQELKITFTPWWQSQVFCGYSQVLRFYVLYMIHSASVNRTAWRGQEAWGMRNRSLSLLSVSSTSQSEEDALASLFFASRSCTCKYLCVSGHGEFPSVVNCWQL